MYARKLWNDIIKVMKGKIKYCHLRILHKAKISFNNEEAEIFFVKTGTEEIYCRCSSFALPKNC